MTTRQTQNQIVFIDSAVADPATLLAGLPPGMEVVMLEPGSDGLGQITAALAGRSNLQAIHLISHGSSGQILLGNISLDSDTLESHSHELAAMGQSLSESGDILLYGCHVAAGETGAQFIGKLARMTGADVAASDDLTGAANLGGNWVLERQQGSIESPGLNATDYNGVLGYTNVNFTTIGGFTNGLAQDSYHGSTDVPGIAIYFGAIQGGGVAFRVIDTDENGSAVTPGASQYLGNVDSFVLQTGNDTSDFDIQKFSVYNAGNANEILTITGYAEASAFSGTTVIKTVTASATVSEWTTIDLTGFVGISSLRIAPTGTDKPLSFNQFHLQKSNTAPTLTAFSAAVATGDEDTEIEVTLAALKAQGNEADGDGTVDAFVIKALSTGTLKIGTSAGTATAWAASSNDTVDATHHAYWTGAQDANGSLNAFTVVAKDNAGAESSTAQQVVITVANVNDLPTGSVTITGTATQGETLTATNDLADVDGIPITGAGAISYQWYADSIAIAGANNSTYALTQAEVDKTITVTATYTDALGTIETVNATATAAVANVNDEPAITVPSTTAFTEQTAVAASSAITLNDADGDADWDGGSLKVEITANSEVADSLSLLTTDPGSNGIWLDTTVGNQLMAGSIQIGIADAASVANGNAWTFTFNASATNALVQATAQAVQFNNSSDTPGTASRSVTFTATDKNAAAASGVQTISVTTVNDAPTLAGVPGSPHAVTAGTAAALVDFTVADVDGSPLTVTLTATNGTLNGLTDTDSNSGNGIQLSGTAADINSAIAAATFTATAAGSASIAISVSDGIASAVTGTYHLTASNPPAPDPDPPPPPSPPTTTVDGTTVQTTTNTTTVTNPDGTTSTLTTNTLVVEPVQANRPEDATTPNSQLADIPLVTDSTGGAVLTAGLPVGVGLQVVHTSSGGTGGGAVSGHEGLIQAILARAQAVDHATEGVHMSGFGSVFLQGLPTGTDLLVRTLIPTVATGVTQVGQPIVLQASANLGSQQEALVIDTTRLPIGTTINLGNVEFAAVIGSVHLTGGAGAQFVIGDSAAQFMVLGEDDDILFGGAGNDTVGSMGGNDRLFGNAGNDTLFGGAGANFLHGGTDSDVATFSGNIERYDIVRDHGKTTVRSLDVPGDIDTLVNVEVLRFANADYTVKSAQPDIWIASLYDRVLGRQAELGGFQYWTQAHDAGYSMGDIALSFLHSAEYQKDAQAQQFDNLSDSAQLDLFYQHFLGRMPDAPGHAYWMQRLQEGTSLADVAQSFVVSIEMQGMYVQPTGWEFIV